MKTKTVKAGNTLELWLSYVGPKAPSNASGAREGLGETKEQATAAAEHFANQAPFEKFRRVTLSDWPRMVEAPSEETAMAFRALDQREYVDTEKAREVGRLLDAGRYASAWRLTYAKGRPSKGLSQVALNLRLPGELATLTEKAADDAQVTASEWWRRAGAHYLSCAHAGVLADED